MKKTRVIILFGGRSAEHEISLLSARNVLSALDRDAIRAGAGRHRQGRTLAPRVGADARRGGRRSARGSRSTRRAPAVGIEDALAAPRTPGAAETVGGDDVVFPVLHGTFGEDGTVQGAARARGRRVRRRGRARLRGRNGQGRRQAPAARRGHPVVTSPWSPRRAFRRAIQPRRCARCAEPRLSAVRQAGKRRVVGRRVTRRRPGRARRRRARGARLRQQGAGRARRRRARNRVRRARQRRTAGVGPGRDRRPPRGRFLLLRRQVRRPDGASWKIPAELPAGRHRARAGARGAPRFGRSSWRGWRASISS